MRCPPRRRWKSENIFVMTEHRAMHQDIRPLRLLLLNLMPTKITTETQILRKLSNTPLQVEVEASCKPSATTRRTRPPSTWRPSTPPSTQCATSNFDGLIITGAPVERAANSRRWTTGRNSARSWSGRRPTCTPRCTSAGAPKPASTITTACPSTSCPRRCSACSPTRWSSAPRLWCAGSTT